MYQIAVPVINHNLSRIDLDAFVPTLKKAGVGRVLLAMGVYPDDPKKRKEWMKLLRENCAFFHSEGFEVGVWIWTFWVDSNAPFTRMRSVEGVDSKIMACPADLAFREYAAGFMREFAASGVDLILFDDDFRFGFQDMGLGCTCKLHEAMMGEPFQPEKLLSGGSNPHRDRWQQVKAQSLKEFAAAMRAAVDSVNPKVRLGVCACMSLWDLDGVDAATISRILAGNTKPYLRTIGAPYWAVKRSWGNRVQDVIELTRMERSWSDDDIEIVSEGDCYPRPRTTCPAAYLEALDTALRADGTMDGIQKYMEDYHGSDRYERGYFNAHFRNQPLYAQIEEAFHGKSLGVRVYESMTKYAETEIPPIVKTGKLLQQQFFPVAARMLAACSVPTVYEGEGVCGIVFGENARHLPQSALNKGLILDLRAAELLTEQGIDVGLCGVGKSFRPCEEYFPAYNEYAGIFNGTAQKITVAPEAEVLSYYEDAPASYYYKNREGNQFLVFAFYGYWNGPEFTDGETFWRQYTRARQLGDVIARFGEPLPAHTWGHPDLYLLCRETATGLWNLHPDAAYDVRVSLTHAHSVSFVNCSGRFEEGVATIEKIEPYGVAIIKENK